MTEPMLAAPDSTILQPGHPFTAPELAVLCAEGTLRLVLPGTFVCAAVDDSPALRSAAVAALVGPRLREDAVIGRLTAAWVHGHHPMPAGLELLVTRFHRLPLHRDGLRTALHECLLQESEIDREPPMAVTTPLRTALDLAFHGEPVSARRAISRMLVARHSHCRREQLLEAIQATGRRPGKRAALELVHALPRLGSIP
ncbi:hypothetical protein [Arthrobacter sp. JSM 101049]|uniref:hypothetical protein n=1 Tax=Arthrobacter sp. JSM 101049 TaxID=929097 RepID=UPI003565DDAB